MDAGGNRLSCVTYSSTIFVCFARTVHSQTRSLIRILNASLDVRSLGAMSLEPDGEEGSPNDGVSSLGANTLEKWNELQVCPPKSEDG